MPLVTTLISKEIVAPNTVTTCNITATFSGTLTFQITANSSSPSPTWQTVPLVNGVAVTITFSVPGTSIKYRVIGNSGDILYGNLLIDYGVTPTYPDNTGTITFATNNTVAYLQDILILKEV